jgi:hypothetical protein
MATAAAVAACGIGASSASAYDLAMTEREATTTLVKAIRRQAPHPRALQMTCRVNDDANTAACDAKWTSERRHWSGHAKIVRRDTATAEVISYTLRSSETSRVAKLRGATKRGTVQIAIPKGVTRANPLPIGSSIIAGQWRIAVLSVTPDATEQVLAENLFNDAPDPGRQDVLATISATYLGATASSVGADLTFYVVGPSAVAYSPYMDDCGVIPNDIEEQGDVFHGGIATGNVCWQVDSSDAGALVMYTDDSASPRYFALP